MQADAGEFVARALWCVSEVVVLCVFALKTARCRRVDLEFSRLFCGAALVVTPLQISSEKRNVCVLKEGMLILVHAGGLCGQRGQRRLDAAKHVLWSVPSAFNTTQSIRAPLLAHNTHTKNNALSLAVHSEIATTS